MTISKHVLLDESPPELDHIQIEATGRLVWSPSANITLKVSYVFNKQQLVSVSNLLLVHGVI